MGTGCQEDGDRMLQSLVTRYVNGIMVILRRPLFYMLDILRRPPVHTHICNVYKHIFVGTYMRISIYAQDLLIVQPDHA